MALDRESPPFAQTAKGEAPSSPSLVGVGAIQENGVPGRPKEAYEEADSSPAEAGSGCRSWESASRLAAAPASLDEEKPLGLKP